ncbi:MAG: hypothetical protein HOF44_05535 [Pelagibacterales bacterium]|nr:hypothetical protein [Pelagibacterales bacterium]
MKLLYKMCLGLMFILVATLFFLHIFYQTPDYNQSLSFSLEEMVPASEEIVAIVYEE